MELDKDQIRDLIPQAGSMCLLDGVVAWDHTQIRCISRTHLDMENPLRFQDRLSPLALVEYGAQAAAVHGGLLAKHRKQPSNCSLLAAIHETRFRTDGSVDLCSELHIVATLLLQSETGAVYSVNVSNDGAEVLVEARISIVHTGT